MAAPTPATTIGDWDKRRLAQFVQQAIVTSPAQLPPSLIGQEIHATDLLRVGDRLELSDRAMQYLKDALGL